VRRGPHGGDAAHVDEDAVADGRRGRAVLGVPRPEAAQQRAVHVVPVHIHGAVELRARRSLLFSFGMTRRTCMPHACHAHRRAVRAVLLLWAPQVAWHGEVRVCNMPLDCASRPPAHNAG
jgi:hypothetical protein